MKGPVDGWLSCLCVWWGVGVCHMLAAAPTGCGFMSGDKCATPGRPHGGGVGCPIRLVGHRTAQPVSSRTFCE